VGEEHDVADRPISGTKSENRSEYNKVTTWVVPIATLGVIVVVIVAIFFYGYTTRPGWVGISDKTFWDYLDLLIVPVALALGVYWLDQVQSKREREAENQRAQSEALQAYLNAMDALLRDVSLSDVSDQSTFINRELAQARTITIIATLGAERNRIVTRFLRNLNLTRPPIAILREADLAAAELAGSFLEGADLSGADLSGADLREASLSEAYLKGTDLSGADLRRADLSGADLREASLGEASLLSGADLSGAYLGGTDLREVDLSGVDLSGAGLGGAYLGRAYLREVDLSGADLSGADLGEADLGGTDLGGADLRGTYLSRANLDGANLGEAELGGAYLGRANLTGVQGVTQEQLDQAKSLEGATMPNGQKYEDWLEDRQRREQKH
jgi:uncharacterized protein YjbI with pentapeptide repeats